MNAKNSLAGTIHRLAPRGEITNIAPALAILCFVVQSLAQGTMTIGFDAQPPGTISHASVYNESGMRFWNPNGPHTLVLNGGVVTFDGTHFPFPENGTSYLQPSGDGAWLAFQSTSLEPFGLLSLDLAEYSTNSLAPITVHVVGYGLQGQRIGEVNLTTDGINDGIGPLADFQTFTLDSRFANLYRVEMTTDFWSLDNIVISGVPEPSTSALLLLAAACAFGRSWIRRKRP